MADVLVAGKNGRTAADFTGKLPFAWPATAASPIADPLFARGYGLNYASRITVPALSEDPGMDMAEALNIANFFTDGRVRTPWTLSIADAGGKRPVEVRSTRSPDGLVAIDAVDVRAQEDGKRVTFTGPGQIAIEGPSADLSGRVFRQAMRF